jgi:hypothetical protein
MMTRRSLFYRLLAAGVSLALPADRGLRYVCMRVQGTDEWLWGWIR